MAEEEGMSEETATALIFFMLVCSLPCLFAALGRIWKNRELEQQKREAARKFINDPAALEEAMFMIDSQRVVV